MRKFLKFFLMRKSDFRGFSFLFLIAILALAFKLIIAELLYKNSEIDIVKYNNFADSLNKVIEFRNNTNEKEKDNIYVSIYDTIELYSFNPNTASYEIFKSLGLTNKQISIIDNYRKKGGKFNTKSDFAKMFCISKQQFEILEPYLDLPNEIQQSNLVQKQEHLVELFNFDPNICTEIEFKMLGLSDKQIKVIDNYRNKGGKFRKKEDFAKMYCISAEEYKKLEPFIVIEENTDKKYDQEKVDKVFTGVIEINSADTSHFKQLPGVNSFLAKKIVNYRKRLGGFYNTDQIKEVYGMKEEIFENIRMFLTVDASTIEPLNINYLDYKELVVHPYIDNEMARSIDNYKRKNGLFLNVEQLTQNGVLTKEQYEKIKFYIIVK